MNAQAVVRIVPQAIVTAKSLGVSIEAASRIRFDNISSPVCYVKTDGGMATEIWLSDAFTRQEVLALLVENLTCEPEAAQAFIDDYYGLFSRIRRSCANRRRKLAMARAKERP